MKTIKFRGKRIDNGEWIEGYYGYKDLTDEHFILVPTFDSHNLHMSQYFTEYLVDPRTLMQYTESVKDGHDITDWEYIFD